MQSSPVNKKELNSKKPIQATKIGLEEKNRYLIKKKYCYFHFKSVNVEFYSIQAFLLGRPPVHTCTLEDLRLYARVETCIFHKHLRKISQICYSLSPLSPFAWKRRDTN